MIKFLFLCIFLCDLLEMISSFKNITSTCFKLEKRVTQSCPTLRPQRWQPTRLPRPWDSPGKNTGVGCHFLLQCMKMKSESEVAQSRRTLSYPHGLQPIRLLHPFFRGFPGKSTGVGCHCLLQGIFLTQGLNPGLLHCRWILYCLSHKGSPFKT